MDLACIIPARYESTRFPGKPLANINGYPMIKHVWDKCFEFTGNKDNIFVATDDERIEKVCKDFSINTIMTSSKCLTGTDRVAEASRIIGANRVINVQGDEPLICAKDIALVAEQSCDVCCGMCDILSESDFYSINVPKVVTDAKGNLLYMSRSPIPISKKEKFITAKKQVCIYGFSSKSLYDFCEQKKKTPLESIEDIEILRFLEMGYKVKMVQVSNSSIAVDEFSDIKRVEDAIRKI